MAVTAVAVAVLLASVPSGEGRELRSGSPASVAAATLGVTYGPYLGKRCRHVAYPGCELIGIDVVFRRAATRVLAIAGDPADQAPHPR